MIRALIGRFQRHGYGAALSVIAFACLVMAACGCQSLSPEWASGRRYSTPRPAARSSASAKQPGPGENQAVVPPPKPDPAPDRSKPPLPASAKDASAAPLAKPAAPPAKPESKPAAPVAKPESKPTAPVAKPEPKPDTAKPSPRPGAEADAASVTWHNNNTNSAMRLRAGLMVNVSVLVAGKKEIEETAKRVADGGTLNLPMLGAVPVHDETTESLEKILTTRYREFFVNPQVLVDIVHDDYREGVSPWGYVTVLGRVKSPGRIGIPATRDLTITRAIQQAGGFDTSAKDTAIRLTRRKADGTVESREVNLKAVGSSGKLENDLELRADDVVFVPELVF